MFFKKIVTLTLAFALNACFDGESERIAASAEFYKVKNGNQMGEAKHWVSFKPSAVAHLKDEIIDIDGFKFPKYNNICVWRDHSVYKPKDEPIKSILFSCLLGFKRHKVERRNKSFYMVEYALFSFRWEQVDGKLVMDGYNVSVTSEKLQFSSRGESQELNDLTFHKADIKLPQKHSDILSFDVDLTLPYRLNSGEKPKEPKLRIRIKGIAEPIPAWVTY